jgi:hypothetical protein
MTGKSLKQRKCEEDNGTDSKDGRSDNIEEVKCDIFDVITSLVSIEYGKYGCER